MLERFDLVSQGEAIPSCPLSVSIQIGQVKPDTEAILFGKSTCIF